MPKPPKPQTKAQYEDLTGLTEKRLDLGLWYVEHLHQLKKYFIIFLIFIATISWSYFLFGFIYYLSIGMKEDQKLANETANSGIITHEYFTKNQPMHLNYGTTITFPSGSASKYDFFTEIENPNNKHWVEFDYYYAVNGESLEKLKAFILPGEKKPIIALGRELKAHPFDPRIIIENIAWHRIATKEINDIEKFKSDHAAFTVKDFKFNPSKGSSAADKVIFNELEGEITNSTVYNYWNANFIIILYQGGQPVSVGKYGIENFLSGSSYQVNLTWPGDIGKVDEVKVIGDTNIFEKNNYMKFEGTVEDKEVY